MFFLYNSLIYIADFLLKIIALFNKKIGFFVNGRKESFDILERKIKPSDKTFWIHVSSLGEYEQGLPIMEALKKRFPNYKIVLTFFSPSGYEVKKNNDIADATLYLPMDTRKNAKKFLKMVNPEKAFFIKYEYWPNYLRELKAQNIDTYLISGILRPNQLFFKWYGSFYRKSLQAFTHFFVQNSISKELLHSIGFNNVTISGDTRFDRVSQILENDNTLDFANRFKNNKTTVIIGSSWPKDEELIVKFINNHKDNSTKFIFAPHNIKPELIQNLKSSIQREVLLYSEINSQNITDYSVLIIDAYSLLTKVYSYGDIAYVGGGFGAGIHNILEPATFGIPVIIGPNYKKFQEANDLVQLNGVIVVENFKELENNLNALLNDEEKRKQIGSINSKFISSNRNATQKVMEGLL